MRIVQCIICKGGHIMDMGIERFSHEGEKKHQKNTEANQLSLMQWIEKMAYESVLIVEQNSDARFEYRKIIYKSGFNVLEANNWITALELAERYSREKLVFLVIGGTMYLQPESSNVITLITNIHPDIKILCIADDTKEIDLYRYITPNAHLLCQPFTPADFVLKVRQLLSRD